jgi:hypothetical protein
MYSLVVYLGCFSMKITEEKKIMVSGLALLHQLFCFSQFMASNVPKKASLPQADTL